jgi:hypothetical protein
MEEESKILQKLEMLKDEHRSLDHKINHENLSPFELQSFKRKKLMLKDQISYFSRLVHPDIIA